MGLVNRDCSWVMNHFNLSCELVSHQYLWRGKCWKVGGGRRGDVRCDPPPRFLMEMFLLLHQLMTSPNLIQWSKVANIKCVFVFTSESNMATSHSLKWLGVLSVTQSDILPKGLFCLFSEVWQQGMLFLVFCKEKCGLQSLKEPLDEGNQRRKEKSRPLPSDNHTNTGPLGTLNGKHV